MRKLNARLKAWAVAVLTLSVAAMTGAALAARPNSASPATTPVPVFGLKPVVFLPAVLGPSHFMALTPGSALPSDAVCAARVRQKSENKRVNAVYNATTGHQRLGDDLFSGSDPRANTEIAVRVTGNFSGTTDMILQWAACKWGIDEDIVRAQAAVESWWRQSAKGTGERTLIGVRPVMAQAWMTRIVLTSARKAGVCFRLAFHMSARRGRA